MDIPKQIKELNKQLYPTGRAWGFAHGSEQVDTEIEVFVDGLGDVFVDGVGNSFISIHGSEASPSKRLINALLKSYERLYANVISILDTIIPDNDEFSTVDASNWERVYGIIGNEDLTLSERKESILRKLTYPNGIAERANRQFIEDQLQANGFDVYVTENRFADGSGGWEVVNPSQVGGNVTELNYSGNDLSITAQDSDARGIFLKPDGLKLYVYGATNKNIFEYDLSTAWDISTAVYNNNFINIPEAVRTFESIYITDDGLNLFAISSNNNFIYKYDLSIAWDVSTVTDSGQSFNASAQITTAQGLYISPNGVKMFLTDDTTDIVYQYSMFPAFDLSTTSYDTISLAVNIIDNNLQGISFNSSGNKIFILGNQNDIVFQYNLPTVFDLTSASYDSSFDLSSEGTTPLFIFSKGDSNKFYISQGDNSIYEYDNVANYTISANYIDETLDSKYFDFLPTTPTECGVHECGDVECGSTPIFTFEEGLRATFFISAAILYDPADVQEIRKKEFRELILKLKPAHTVAYLYINYI